MKVGFIGLGAMGLPMAKNVRKAGYDLVTTYNRRRQPADELAAMGASVVDSPAAVAKAADVVITIVPADAELEAVALGDKGLIQGFSKGKALIDMTSGTAMSLLDVEKALTAKGVKVLDAPVSGGTTAAEDGTLTIMVGGDEDMLETYRSLLEAMGKTILHVGGVGQANVVKMINQVMGAVHILTMAEAFALGVKCGADPKGLYEVIKVSSGYSKMLDIRGPGFLFDGNFEPGFKVDLMKKDVDLAVDSAKALGVPLLFGSLASQVFAAASTADLGDLDIAAAGQYVTELAKVSLSDKWFGEHKK